MDKTDKNVMMKVLDNSYEKALTGTAAADILKKNGIIIGEKITLNVIKKIPGAVLTKINQKVGFRLFTKMGEKGDINIQDVH